MLSGPKALEVLIDLHAAATCLNSNWGLLSEEKIGWEGSSNGIELISSSVD